MIRIVAQKMSENLGQPIVIENLEPIGSPPGTVTQWTGDGLTRMRDIVQRAKIRAE